MALSTIFAGSITAAEEQFFVFVCMRLCWFVLHAVLSGLGFSNASLSDFFFSFPSRANFRSVSVQFPFSSVQNKMYLYIRIVIYGKSNGIKNNSELQIV